MNDIYAKEVKRLTQNPDDIDRSWRFAEPLFKFANLTGESDRHSNCGCLTMIKQYNGIRFKVNIDPSVNSKLQEELMKDNNIPNAKSEIQVKHLKHFARWQRKLDKLRKQFSNA